MLSGQASSQCERVRDPATRVPSRQADYRETHQRDHRRCSSCHKISLFAGEGDRAKGRFLFPENRGHTGTVFHVHAGRGYRQAGDSQSGPKRRERSYLSSFAGLFPASLAGARGLCEKRHRWRRLEKFGYFPEFLKNKSQSEKGAKRNLATCFEATHAGKRNAGSFRQFRLGNIQKQPAFPCPFCKLHLYVMGCLKCRMYVHLISKVLI